MEEKEVGKVSHYFSHLNVAAIELTDSLKVGDMIHIRGHTTDFTQKVDSMQIEHDQVEAASAGQAIGIKVKDHARDHDIVYKVIE